MALELYQRAILTADIPSENLRAGDIGTVVDRHDVPGVPETGYSVEFFDMTGRTIAVVTVPSSSLREPTTQDIPSVRALSGSH
jgi:hypothetical protein